MKKNPESARDTNMIIKWKRILKVARYKRNNQMTENPKSAQNADVIIKWQKILKVREIQTYYSNERES